MYSRRGLMPISFLLRASFDHIKNGMNGGSTYLSRRGSPDKIRLKSISYSEEILDSRILKGNNAEVHERKIKLCYVRFAFRQTNTFSVCFPLPTDLFYAIKNRLFLSAQKKKVEKYSKPNMFK